MSDIFSFTGPKSLPLSQIDRFSYENLQQSWIHHGKKVMKDIVEDAQELTPVRTGKLRAGYDISVTQKYPNITLGIANPVTYFYPVEEGRRVQRAKQYQRTQPVSRVSMTQGVHMLSRSIEKHEKDLQKFEHEILNEVLSLL